MTLRAVSVDGRTRREPRRCLSDVSTGSRRPVKSAAVGVAGRRRCD